jgi:hypothetical protein
MQVRWGQRLALVLPAIELFLPVCTPVRGESTGGECRNPRTETGFGMLRHRRTLLIPKNERVFKVQAELLAWAMTDKVERPLRHSRLFQLVIEKSPVHAEAAGTASVPGTKKSSENQIFAQDCSEEELCAICEGLFKKSDRSGKGSTNLVLLLSSEKDGGGELRKKIVVDCEFMKEGDCPKRTSPEDPESWSSAQPQ